MKINSLSNIRNFAILAHIDHGKSTLSDRLLELTGTVEKRKMKEQILDTMDLERERGITIKLQPVQMIYSTSRVQNDKDVEDDKDVQSVEIVECDKGVEGDNERSDRTSEAIQRAKQYNAFNEPKAIQRAKRSNKASADTSIQSYVLNLIDTPGHVDFAYEVSRSLAAVEGAVLLVDATQGVQAQTISNLYLAIEQDLEIIPVINKIDLPNADAEKVKKEIVHILGCNKNDILEVSGKTGEGVDNLLEEIVKKVPAPSGKSEAPLRALIFDSVYDEYKGVLAYVRIVDGEISKTDKLKMLVTGKESAVVELGHFRPQYEACDKLITGDTGYIATGFKSVKECKVGDTVTLARNFQFSISNLKTNYSNKISDIKNKKNSEFKKINNSKFNQNSKLKTQNSKIEPLPGYAEVQPMVYASFYPVDGSDYNMMRDALDKLTLNDGAFHFEPESNQALGRGFRCGFLGLLHLEIIQARLEREFDIAPTITTPSVVYKMRKKNTNEIVKIYSPTELPDPSQIENIEEPYVKLEIVTPSEYLGKVMELMGNARADYKSTEYIDAGRVQLIFEAPLMDVIIDFHDQLKSISSGYASMNYEPIDYRISDLVKMDILVAGEIGEAFSRIVPRNNVQREGKAVVAKLKDVLSRQNFAIAIQATVGSKVIARATLSAFRKDVTAGLYGGDITRKRKLLEKQKKGKKRMAQSGKVEIPPEAFLKVLRK